MLTTGLAVACVCALSATAASGSRASARSDSKALYLKQMKEVGRDLTASLDSLSAVTGLSLRYPIKPTAARSAVATLTATQGRLRRAAGQLKAVVPPPAVTSAHARLAKGAQELLTELDPVIVKLKQGYLLVAAKLSSLPGAVDIGIALTSFQKQGYPIGPVS